MDMNTYDIHVTVDEQTVAEDEEQATEEIESVLQSAGLSPDKADITVSQSEEDPVDGPKAVLDFSPQAQTRSGEIVSVQSLGREAFTVPLDDVLDEDGRLLPSPSHSLDRLKTHPNAPLWIQLHSGPFDLRIDELKDLPEDRVPGDYHVVAAER